MQRIRNHQGPNSFNSYYLAILDMWLSQHRPRRLQNIQALYCVPAREDTGRAEGTASSPILEVTYDRSAYAFGQTLVT